MKTMAMTTKQNENRTGIYVQESVDATTAGDGLAPKGDKSPVAYNRNDKDYIIQSDDEQDIPHCSGQSRTARRHIDPGKSRYKAPPPKRNQTRKERDEFYKKYFGPIYQFYVSPAIKAGATEADSSYSLEGLQRKREKERAIIKELKTDGMAEARRRMGMRGSHIRRRYSSDEDNSPTRTKKEKFPIVVFFINKANPFGEVDNKLDRMLLMNALETTIQEERCAGNFVKIANSEYRKKVLVARCKNEQTVRFLKNNIQSYNRLWPGADLIISTEPPEQKRFKVRVHLPNYNITSEEFFKIFGKQNGYSTKYWTLYNRREVDGFIAFIGIDIESYTRLKQANGFAYFFFDKIVLGLDCK